jgi:lipoprotein
MKKFLTTFFTFFFLFSCSFNKENISENEEINSPSFKHNNLKDEEKCFILSKDFDFRKI